VPQSRDDLHRYLVRRISAEETYEDLLRFPRYFEIETVNACNARCAMCTIEEWSRNAPSMKDELFARIADELIANKDEIKRVSLYKDGEPLLDKKLAARVAMLKQGGIRQVSISTNVSLLDERKSIDLLEAGLDVITMSIDSLRPDVYEAIRIRLKHEEVMENALRFIRLRDEMKAPAKVWVRMIRQESNWDEWPEFEAFWKERLQPGDRVNYHNLHNWGSQLKGFNPVQTESFEPGLPCVALWSQMVIFANGDVPLCTIDYNNRHPTGNVGQSSIAELWRSQVVAQRREWHLTGKKACIDICENCNVWDEPPDVARVAAEYADKVTLA
jgi:radical SAM protein with 4Fe4S-binding SPASM domain